MESRCRERRREEPLDRILFRSDLLCVGAFRASVDDPRFHDSGPIQRHIFVFPRTSVVIRHRGGHPFATDTRLVTYYNRGQRYTRRAVDGRGDRCDWFALRPDVIRDALAPHDPDVRRRPDAPFRCSHGPSDRDSYLLQRMVVRHLQGPGPPDPLAVEEAALHLLGRLAELAAGRPGPCPKAAPPTDPTTTAPPTDPTATAQPTDPTATAPPRDPTATAPSADATVAKQPASATEARRRADPMETARRARRLLAERFAEPLTLEEIAARVGSSAYHLCRTFRRCTGTTVHRHRNDLRLRRSLELVAEGRPLIDVALDLGYSSHSHFTAAFRRAFGLVPSEFRATASSRRIRELAGRLGASDR